MTNRVVIMTVRLLKVSLVRFPSPVLKVTERRENRLPSTAYTEKKIGALSSTPSGGSTSSGQSALKAADDHTTRGKKPPFPVATCRVEQFKNLVFSCRKDPNRRQSADS